MKHTYKSKYGLGDLIYLSTDIEQRPRMITGVEFSADGGTLYHVIAGIEASRHYEVEKSLTVNEGLRLGLEINSN